MRIYPIRHWNMDGKSSSELFLMEDEFPDLYKKAKDKYEEFSKDDPSLKESVKKVVKPVIQLSPKGLALISHLYAIKDKNESQPLVASTVSDFSHIIKLIDDASIGTSVVVIFQMTDLDDQEISKIYSEQIAVPDCSSVHKTVYKIEKREIGICILCMESTNGYYGLAGSRIAEFSLQGNAKRKGKKEATKIVFASQVNPEIPHPIESDESIVLSRQVDEYQCGTFVLKDARQLARDQLIMDKVFSKFSKFRKIKLEDIVIESRFEGIDYEFPPEYLKAIQSGVYTEFALKKDGNKIVNRKGHTLQQVYQKHGPAGYIQHFSEKFYNAVLKFTESYPFVDEVLINIVEKYDAGKISLERLEKLYGPKSRAETSLITDDSVDQLETITDLSKIAAFPLVPDLKDETQQKSGIEILEVEKTKKQKAVKFS